MSLPALVFLLILTLFAALWEYLLWWAFRHGNRVVLLHSTGLVLLLFALPLLIALYVLEKPFLQASWPWSWVSDGIVWLLAFVIIAPFLVVGVNLLWNGPKSPAASPPAIDWSLVWVGPAVGCLLGVIAAFHWLGLTSLPWLSEPGHSRAPILFGAFRLDEFFYTFLWFSILFTVPRLYTPRLN